MPHSDFPAIVIGTSMGGIETLQRLCTQLPGDLNAAVFITQHMGAGSVSVLPDILQRVSSLRVRLAENGGDIVPGSIYLAVPDLHLLLIDHVTMLTRGPKENHSRPSIDVLFRSAAAAFGPMCIGVVLTGLLDDGTAGLSAVKRAGGITVVQDPKDALYPEMPMNALAYVEPDHVVPVAQMGRLLVRLVREARPASGMIPEDLLQEVNFMRNKKITDQDLAHWKDVSLSCPECSGPLRESSRDSIPRFRCMVGHAFSIGSLVDAQDRAAEDALWSAVRVLEERSKMLARLSGSQKEQDRPTLMKDTWARAEEARRSAEVIRNLLLKREVESKQQAANVKQAEKDV